MNRDESSFSRSKAVARAADCVCAIGCLGVAADVLSRDPSWLARIAAVMCILNFGIMVGVYGVSGVLDKWK